MREGEGKRERGVCNVVTVLYLCVFRRRGARVFARGGKMPRYCCASPEKRSLKGWGGGDQGRSPPCAPHKKNHAYIFFIC